MTRLRLETAAWLSVDLLEQHPDNIRHDVGPLEDLDELGASLRAQGNLQPLLVTRSREDRDVYLVIDGNRRLAAARRALVDRLLCVVIGDGATPGAVLAAMIAADIRRPLAPMEQAAAFARLRALGLGYDLIAQRTGHSAATVRERIRLLSLPTPVQEQVQTGAMTLRDAGALAKQTERTGTGTVTPTVTKAAHFTTSHPLASRLDCEHETRRQYGPACGPCWERVISQSAISPKRNCRSTP